METKWCPQCEEDRPISEFYRTKRYDGLSPLCVMHARAAGKRSAERKRREAIEALGGCCQHCNFADVRALQIDHPNGGGSKARKRGIKQNRLYREVIENPGHFLLLCANCNWIKKHERKETVGDRVYVRNPPTKKQRGIGRGNAPAQIAALARARTSEHQAKAARAKKGIPNPKVAEARRGTKLVNGHWVKNGT